jgi:hypothetical protein
VYRLCRQGARVFIDSAQNWPGIPSGPDVTSPRDSILFVAASNSSSVTRSSSLHPEISLEWEDGVLALSLSVQSRRHGNKVPRTLSSSPGSVFAVSGGGAVVSASS